MIQAIQLYSEANRFETLARTGRQVIPEIDWYQANGSDTVEFSVNTKPVRVSPCTGEHPDDLVKRVSFNAVEPSDPGHTLVRVDYSFRRNGSIIRDIHHRAWGGRVAQVSVGIPDGRMHSHMRNELEPLSREAEAVLDQWNIAH